MKSIKHLLVGTLLAAGLFVVGSASASADSLYTVQSGDTLSTISVKFAGNNSLVEKIAKANKIENVNLIFSGEKLNIPGVDKVVNEAPTQDVQPVAVQEAPVQEAPVQAEPVQEAAPVVSTSSAKEWIAMKESSGSYDARNGRYVGRYQLDSSYLNGDFSPANQERVAEQYVSQRYGSWEAAQSFWLQNGWY